MSWRDGSSFGGVILGLQHCLMREKGRQIVSNGEADHLESKAKQRAATGEERKPLRTAKALASIWLRGVGSYSGSAFFSGLCTLLLSAYIFCAYNSG